VKTVALASLLALAGCIIQPLPEKPATVASACPAVAPASSVPKPVWPDNCVADWYAKATLPACVEDYLESVKAEQKKIAGKKAGQ
jgi:hypothetical protein